MRKVIFAAVFTVQSVLASAQSQTGKINGFIKSHDNKPLESATVSLLKAKDSSLVKIAIADKTGAYKFENMRFGRYLIQAEAIG